MNIIYIWNGNGYKLQEIKTNKKEMSIEELCFICVTQNKGHFITLSSLQDEEIEELENSDIYVYVDLSIYEYENGYFLIENLYSNEVKIYS